MNYRLQSNSVEDTVAAGRAMACALTTGAVIALHGDLGSGKTCFVKGLAMGVAAEGRVTSPTFALLHEYKGRRPLFHIDLYRLDKIDEIFAADMEDCFYAGGLTAVEWAERAAELFPSDSVHIYFKMGKDKNERIIEIMNWPDSIPIPAGIVKKVENKAG